MCDYQIALKLSPRNFDTIKKHISEILNEFTWWECNSGSCIEDSDVSYILLDCEDYTFVTVGEFGTANEDEIEEDTEIIDINWIKDL